MLAYTSLICQIYAYHVVLNMEYLNGPLLYFHPEKPLLVSQPYLSWTAARDACRSRGMDLMTLETEYKEQMLYELVKDADK